MCVLWVLMCVWPCRGGCGEPLFDLLGVVLNLHVELCVLVEENQEALAFLPEHLLQERDLCLTGESLERSRGVTMRFMKFNRHPEGLRCWFVQCGPVHARATQSSSLLTVSWISFSSSAICSLISSIFPTSSPMMIFSSKTCYVKCVQYKQ